MHPRGRGRGKGKGKARVRVRGSSSSASRGNERADDYDEFRGQTPSSNTLVLHDEDAIMSEVPLSTPISTASRSRTTRGPNGSMGTPQNPRQRPSLVIFESGR